MGNKGSIAGVLSIISGVFGLLGAVLMIILISFVNAFLEADPGFSYSYSYPFDLQSVVGAVYGTIGAVLAVFGILGIVGGIYAIQRKYWGLGLTAAIGSIITFFPCGIAATIIIALGKSEFDRSPGTAQFTSQPPPAAQPPSQT